MNDTPKIVGTPNNRRLAIFAPMALTLALSQFWERELKLVLHPDLCQIGVPGLRLNEPLHLRAEDAQVEIVHRVQYGRILHDRRLRLAQQRRLLAGVEGLRCLGPEIVDGRVAVVAGVAAAGRWYAGAEERQQAERWTVRIPGVVQNLEAL